jgi:hypothetical protein
MYSRKADSSSVKIGQKLKSSSSVLGKKSTKVYAPVKDGQNPFNHKATYPLEKVRHESH